MHANTPTPLPPLLDLSSRLLWWLQVHLLRLSLNLFLPSSPPSSPPLPLSLPSVCTWFTGYKPLQVRHTRTHEHHHFASFIHTAPAVASLPPSPPLNLFPLSSLPLSPPSPLPPLSLQAPNIVRGAFMGLLQSHGPIFFFTATHDSLPPTLALPSLASPLLCPCSSVSFCLYPVYQAQTLLAQRPQRSVPLRPETIPSSCFVFIVHSPLNSSLTCITALRFIVWFASSITLILSSPSHLTTLRLQYLLIVIRYIL